MEDGSSWNTWPENWTFKLNFWKFIWLMRNFDKKRRCCKDQRKMLFCFGVWYEYFLFFFSVSGLTAQTSLSQSLFIVQFSTFFEKSCISQSKHKTWNFPSHFEDFCDFCYFVDWSLKYIFTLSQYLWEIVSFSMHKINLQFWVFENFLIFFWEIMGLLTVQVRSQEIRSLIFYLESWQSLAKTKF